MAKKPKSINRLVGAEPCSMNSPEMRRYRAEEDVRTLQRAGEIKADSSRLKAAKALATQQSNDLKKVCQ